MILITTKEPINDLELLTNGIKLALLTSEEGLEAEEIIITPRRNKNNQYFIGKECGTLKEDSYDIIRKLTEEYLDEANGGLKLVYKVEENIEKEIYRILVDEILKFKDLESFSFNQNEIDTLIKELCDDLSNGTLYDELRSYVYKNHLFESDSDWEDFTKLDWAFDYAYDDSVYQYVEDAVVEAAQKWKVTILVD